MNDYLDNLIAKSLGLTEVVAPRPMSLFEPLPSDAGPITPDHYLLEQDGASLRTPADVAPGDVMPAGVMPTGVMTGVMMDVATPPAPADESSEKPQPRAAQSDQPSQHPVQSIDRSLSQSTPLLVPHQPLGGDVGQRVDRAERATTINQQMIDGHPAVSEHTPSRVVLHATILAERQTLATPKAPPFTSAQAKASERAMAITPAPPAHTLLIAPALDQERGNQLSDRAAAPPPAPKTEAPEAPTIKITIGRVDVRAVMPERPEPRPTPATRNTALTLEEYLKRRSGGKL